ncbi:MAG TPA: DUF881 domain-containing protein [Clostridiales bacterium]|nr:DUF881 domain-containing protein [Clostridiales bacterium]
MDEKAFKVITVICVFLGFFTALAVQSNGPAIEIENIGSIKTVEGLLKEKESYEKKREELLEELKEREKRLSQLEGQAVRLSDNVEDIEKQLLDLRMMAGLVDVEGPGIEITLNDRKREDIIYSNPGLIENYIVHDSDLLNVVNELRAAGAEAISINDTRIIETSRISCGGPTINIGKGQRFAPPFIIRAIGNPDELANFFKREDSIYHVLDAWGLEFTIKKSDNIYIPRYIYGDLDYKYAKIVKEGD